MELNDEDVRNLRKLLARLARGILAFKKECERGHNDEIYQKWGLDSPEAHYLIAEMLLEGNPVHKALWILETLADLGVIAQGDFKAAIENVDRFNRKSFALYKGKDGKYHVDGARIIQKRIQELSDLDEAAAAQIGLDGLQANIREEARQKKNR